MDNQQIKDRMVYNELPVGLFVFWLSDIYIKDNYGCVWQIGRDCRVLNTPVFIQLVYKPEGLEGVTEFPRLQTTPLRK